MEGLVVLVPLVAQDQMVGLEQLDLLAEMAVLEPQAGMDKMEGQEQQEGLVEMALLELLEPLEPQELGGQVTTDSPSVNEDN